MNPRKLRFLTLLIAGSLLLCAPEAEAGVLEFPDEVNAKVARSKAKKRLMKSGQNDADGGGGSGSSSAGCGSLEVGNVQTGGRGGPREVTVIVTGDVVNANNNCR